MSNWIKVSDRLPEVYESCIFYTGGDKGYLSYFVGRFEDQEKNYVVGMTLDIYEPINCITHWMQLLPPKERNDEST